MSKWLGQLVFWKASFASLNLTYLTIYLLFILAVNLMTSDEESSNTQHKTKPELPFQKLHRVILITKEINQSIF